MQNSILVIRCWTEKGEWSIGPTDTEPLAEWRWRQNVALGGQDLFGWARSLVISHAMILPIWEWFATRQAEVILSLVQFPQGYHYQDTFHAFPTKCPYGLLACRQLTLLLVVFCSFSLSLYCSPLLSDLINFCSRVWLSASSYYHINSL